MGKNKANLPRLVSFYKVFMMLNGMKSLSEPALTYYIGPIIGLGNLVAMIEFVQCIP